MRVLRSMLLAVINGCAGFPASGICGDITIALAYLDGAPFAMAAAVPPGLDAGYPGGNVRIVSREGDTFTLAPDLRDTKGWWFYFNFRLRGPADQPVTIRFADADPIGVRGPAMSSDGGRTWQWLGRKAVLQSGKKGWSFQAVVPAGAREARYAFAPTYLESHLRDWLAAHQANPALQVSELCRSRKGRSVELLRAGCLDLEKARGVVLLTARHHACESMASNALEGFLTADGYLPSGVAWNTPASFANGRPNFYWAGDTFSEARFTGAIEIPYADALGMEVHADSARALGRDLARAVLEHLEK